MNWIIVNKYKKINSKIVNKYNKINSKIVNKKYIQHIQYVI